MPKKAALITPLVIKIVLNPKRRRMEGAVNFIKNAPADAAKVSDPD